MTVVKRIQILFGSETGNAEWIAKHLQEQCILLGFESSCEPLNAFKHSNENSTSSESFVLIICSTTGQGEYPLNSVEFVRYLETSPSLCFKFGVLGLGDSNYDDFCSAAKQIDAKVFACGGQREIDLALADDSLGLELVVDPWIDSLWLILDKNVHFDQTKRGLVESKLATLDISKKPKVFTRPFKPINVLESKDLLKGVPQLTNISKSPLPISKLCEDSEASSTIESKLKSVYEYARITSVKCLSRSRTIELSLDIPFSYEPGDSIAVVCPNNEKMVDYFVKRLEIENPRQMFRLEPLTEKDTQALPSYPFPNSYYNILKHYLDLKTIPRKSFFKLLADYARDPNEKNLLLFLTSKQGLPHYKKIPFGVTLFDVFEYFQSTCPPFELLIENLLPLQPRYYSIASYKTCRIKIAHSVVEYEIEGSKRRGLCSGWLDDLTGNCISGEKTFIEPIEIPVFLRKSTFKLADNNKHIFLAAGTGITPFMGFLEQLKERILNKSTNTTDKSTNELNNDKSNNELNNDNTIQCVMFYGCRNEDEYLYKLEDYPIDLNVIFSRRPELNSSPDVKYIQHELFKQRSKILKLMLEQDAVIYVCGSVGMAKDIHSTFVNMLIDSGLGVTEANQMFCKWMETKRYRRDVW
jgi:methionine synthase reductase